MRRKKSAKRVSLFLEVAMNRRETNWLQKVAINTRTRSARNQPRALIKTAHCVVIRAH